MCDLKQGTSPFVGPLQLPCMVVASLDLGKMEQLHFFDPKFSEPFKGNFKSCSYDAPRPPLIQLKICGRFQDFVSETVLEWECWST